ncbi:MAG: ABC transporter ATP-binding protein [Cyanobacteria bacterium SBLK]|nr:ABC transporter ATP-binding protein [Cyanobacteria bacterium SBLK]
MTQTAQPLRSSPPEYDPLHPEARGVKLRSLTKKYGSVVAVENITLDIPAGSYCCLLGPSGCGKTTTLRMLAGHEEVTAGQIYIGDREVTSQPPAQRNTAMVFQNYALFPHKTVWDNVGFGLKIRGMKERDRAVIIEEMLDIMGMGEFARRKPHQLSGGQQQRIALARALATRPQVLLLDEPLSALDESLRVKTRGELKKLQKKFGMTFIQVTHAQDEAFSLSDLIVVMDRGRVDQVGNPSEIYRSPASQFVARFVGDNNIFIGKVTDSSQEGDRDIITLEVDGIESLLATGHAIPIGTKAACCVRSDLMHLHSYSQSSQPISNSLSARISSVEFTGYITRVSLLQENNGKELLYKTRTEDWLTENYQEGQLVNLSWSPNECIFLSH